MVPIIMQLDKCEYFGNFNSYSQPIEFLVRNATTLT